MGRMWCERWSVSWHEWVLTQTHTGTQSRLVHYKKWCGILLQYEQQEHELRKSRRLFLVLSHLSSQIDVNQATDLIRLKEFVSRILKQKVLQLIWCFRFYWKHRRLTVFILSWICLRWLIFFKKCLPDVFHPSRSRPWCPVWRDGKAVFRSRRCRPLSAQCGKEASALAGPYNLGTPPERAEPAWWHKRKKNLMLKPLLNSDSNDKDKLLW